MRRLRCVRCNYDVSRRFDSLWSEIYEVCSSFPRSRDGRRNNGLGPTRLSAIDDTDVTKAAAGEHAQLFRFSSQSGGHVECRSTGYNYRTVRQPVVPRICILPAGCDVRGTRCRRYVGGQMSSASRSALVDGCIRKIHRLDRARALTKVRGAHADSEVRGPRCDCLFCMSQRSGDRGNADRSRLSDFSAIACRKPIQLLARFNVKPNQLLPKSRDGLCFFSILGFRGHANICLA